MNVSHKRKETNTTTTTMTNSLQNMTSNPNTNSNLNILSRQEKSAIMKNADAKVKTFLEPHYSRGKISKECYKQIMRKCVNDVYERSKVAHVKDDEISNLVDSRACACRTTPLCVAQGRRGLGFVSRDRFARCWKTSALQQAL